MNGSAFVLRYCVAVIRFISGDNGVSRFGIGFVTRNKREVILVVSMYILLDLHYVLQELKYFMRCILLFNAISLHFDDVIMNLG